MQVILQTRDNVLSDTNEGLLVTLNERTLKKLIDVEDYSTRDEDYQYDFIMNEIRKYVDNRNNKYLSNTTCEKIWQWVQEEKVKWFKILM